MPLGAATAKDLDQPGTNFKLITKITWMLAKLIALLMMVRHFAAITRSEAILHCCSSHQLALLQWLLMKKEIKSLLQPFISIRDHVALRVFKISHWTEDIWQQPVKRSQRTWLAWHTGRNNSQSWRQTWRGRSTWFSCKLELKNTCQSHSGTFLSLAFSCLHSLS